MCDYCVLAGAVVYLCMIRKRIEAALMCVVRLQCVLCEVTKLVCSV